METKCNNCGKIGEGMIGGMGAYFCDKDCEKEYFADEFQQYDYTVKAVFHDVDPSRFYCMKCASLLQPEGLHEFLLHRHNTGKSNYSLLTYVCINCNSTYRLGD